MDLEVKVEQLNSIEKKLSVKVPVKYLKEKIERVYDEIAKTARVDGFRQGHVPREVLKSHYHQRVFHEAFEAVLSAAYSQAVRDNKIPVVGKPQIDLLNKLEEEKPIEFTAQVEVIPEINVKDYRGVKLTKEKLNINEEMVQNQIDQLRESRAKLAPLDKEVKIEKGHFSILDFQGTIDGKPVKEAEATNCLIEVGRGYFPLDFENGLLGLKTGEEKELKVKYDEKHRDKNFAGKEVTFKVEVKEVKEKNLPAIDDEFVKANTAYKTLVELKEVIHKNLKDSSEKRIKNDFEVELLQKIIDKNKFEIPASLVNEQLGYLKEDGRKNLLAQGFPEKMVNEYQEKWNDKLKEKAVFQVKSSLLLKAIAKKENIEPDNLEVEKEYEKAQASLTKAGKPFDKENLLPYIKLQLTEDKVLEFLTANAQVEEVEKKQ